MPGRIERVTIDRNLCIGSSNCVHIAPGVFQLDEEATATVVDLNAAPQDEIIEAARNCPTDAIVVYDADGHQLAP